jgi:hypothetical protein
MSTPGTATANRAKLQKKLVDEAASAYTRFLATAVADYPSQGYSALLTGWQNFTDTMRAELENPILSIDFTQQVESYLSSMEMELANSQILAAVDDKLTELVNAAIDQGMSGTELSTFLLDGLNPKATWFGQESMEAWVTTQATALTSVVELANLGAQGYVEKRWVSHHDEKVRDSHSEADGQTVHMSEEFYVGSAFLQYPGDPNGPAEEIRNCRCVVVGVEESRVAESGEGGLPAWEDGEDLPFADNWSTRTYGIKSREWLREWGTTRDAAKHGVSDDAHDAWTRYTGSSYWDMNAALRGLPLRFGDAPTNAMKWNRQFKQFFDAAAETLTAPLTVYRGVQAGTAKDWAVGDVITDQAWMSTTVDEDIATGFGSEMFRIQLAPGTKVVYGVEGEQELILEPGSLLRVLGRDRDGTMVLGYEGNAND